jgi:uncharacterized membrane protein
MLLITKIVSFFKINVKNSMIKLVKRLLEIHDYDHLKDEFEDLFLSHPNYPSLFAITDSLDLLSVENIAAKVAKEQLLDLPESFLAFFKEKLVLVYKTDTVIKIDDQNGVNQTVALDAFTSDWNGIIVAIERNEHKIKKEKTYNLQAIKYSLPVLFLFIVSVFFNKYTPLDIVFLATSSLGLMISVFIVQEKFGIKNEMVSKFCNIATNVSCDSVIKSEKNKFLKWANFSEWPLFFFSTSVFCMLLRPSESSLFIGFLSVLSFPVLLFSIWIQKFQIKKWCVLCLAISFLVLTEGLLFLFLNEFSFSHKFSTILLFFFLLVTVYLIWIFIKPFVQDAISAKTELKQIKKFKRNYSVLKFLLRDIPFLDGFENLKGLDFGNKNASLNLSIIINPSCGHCHKAFKESLDLVSRFPERVFLRVLFNINPENTDNAYKVIVDQLLIINKTNPSQIVEAISDRHIKNLDIKQWTEKWGIIPANSAIKEDIQQQYDWCQKNEFNYTPVKIVNGKQFPDEYELSDLKYFLNDFEEQNEFSELITHN